MIITACIGKEFAEHLLAIGDYSELVAFIVGRSAYTLEKTYGLPAATGSADITSIDYSNDADTSKLLRVDANIHRGYYVYYCEHPELHLIGPGFDGLRVAAECGNMFVKDLITTVDKWLTDNNIDAYTLLNMLGYKTNQSAIVVVAKVGG